MSAVTALIERELPSLEQQFTLPELEQAQATVPAEVRQVIARDYRLVWRFLRHLGLPEDQVDDAAQTVFARVLARHAVVRKGVERAYLMKAALHIFFEFRRARRRTLSRQSEVELDTVCGSNPSPDEAFARRQQRALLDTALDELPLELRAAFSLFELEELTFSEIAEVLEIPRGTVASRVRRAREAFTLAAHRLARGGFE